MVLKGCIVRFLNEKKTFLIAKIAQLWLSAFKYISCALAMTTTVKL